MARRVRQRIKNSKLRFDQTVGFRVVAFLFVAALSFSTPYVDQSTSSRTGRSLASKLDPYSIVTEIEEMIIRRLVRPPTRLEQEELKQRIQKAILESFSTHDGRQYSNYKELVKAYEDKTTNQIIKLLDNKIFSQIAKSLNVDEKLLMNVKKGITTYFDESYIPPVRTALPEEAVDLKDALHPHWGANEIRNAERAGKTQIMLKGNVTGKVVMVIDGKTYYLTMEEYLEKMFLKGRDTVVTFRIGSASSEIEFKSGEDLFKTWYSEYSAYRKTGVEFESLVHPRTKDQHALALEVLDKYFRDFAVTQQAVRAANAKNPSATKALKRAAFIVYGAEKFAKGMLAPQVLNQTGDQPLVDLGYLEIFERWARNADFKEGTFLNIMVAEDNGLLARRLNGTWYKEVNVPNPTMAQKVNLVHYMAKTRPEFKELLGDGISIEGFAEAMYMFDLNQLEEFVAQLIIDGKVIVKKDLMELMGKFAQQLAGGDEVVTYMKPGDAFLETTTLMAPLKRKLLRIMKDFAAGITKRVPRGMIFLGLPGYGKTRVINAMANESGVPFFEVKNFLAKYVGEAERKAYVLVGLIQRGAEAGRIGLFVDEFDRWLSAGKGGFDVDHLAGMRAILYPIMADNRYKGKVFWAFATSREIPATETDFLSRYPDIFFLPAPRTVEEKKELLRQLIANSQLQNVKITDFDDAFFEKMEGISGRQMEDAFTSAADKAADDGLDEPTVEHVKKALLNKKTDPLMNKKEAYIIGMCKENPEMIPASTISAIAKSDREFAKNAADWFGYETLPSSAGVAEGCVLSGSLP